MSARFPARAARALALAGAVLLGACASIAPHGPAGVADVAARSAPFEVEGRLSARRGNEGGAAQFSWRHDGERDDVDLSTPLGQTLARLAGDPRGVRAQWPDGRTLDAPDWNALTERAIGVAIPVQGLSAWLRGFARAGSEASVERDPQARPSVLRQDGWEIVYGYADDAQRRANRLTLRYPGPDPTEVRLVIDTWR